MNITIREYQDQDLKSCKQLWRELTQRHRDIYFDPSIGGDDPGIAFEHFLKKTNLAGIWVVEQDALVLGMAGLLVDGGDAEIEPIVIRSEFRSQGIGTLLIERLKTEAKERGVGYLSIRPVARNIEAINCFHRAGFSLLGHIDMFLDLADDGDPEDWKEGITNFTETHSDISNSLNGDPMPEAPIAKKMRLKPGLSAAVINAPDKYLKELKHDSEISESLSGKYDWIQIFVENKAQLDKLFSKVLKLLKPDSILWVSFPKGTSKIQTDLTRDKGWDVIAAADLKWIVLVSVNETWSAFAVRPYKPGEPKQSFS